MLVAIDIDGTYDFFKQHMDVLILSLKAQNEDVIAVTMRFDGERVNDYYENELLALGVPIYYTTRKAKGPYMKALGLEPDLWIDDYPKHILEDAKPDWAEASTL